VFQLQLLARLSQKLENRFFPGVHGRVLKWTELAGVNSNGEINLILVQYEHTNPEHQTRLNAMRFLRNALHQDDHMITSCLVRYSLRNKLLFQAEFMEPKHS